MQLARYPLHPFLLACYFPMLLLSNNMGLFGVEDVYRAISLNLVLAFVLFYVFRLAYRDGGRAAFATTAILGLCFSFRLIGGGPESALSDSLALAVTGVAGLAVVVLASRIPRDNVEAPLILNVFVTVMLIVPVYEVVDAQLADDDPASRMASGIDSAAHDVLRHARMPDTLPSVFHIVADGYSRNDVLQDVYGYDNSAFTSRLRELGFAVSDRATTPYGQTLLAVNSVLSMNYLNDYIAALESDGELEPARLRKVLKRFFYTAPVLQLFEEMGYYLVMTETDYPPLNNPEADYFLESKTDPFALTFYEHALLTTTPFSVGSTRSALLLQAAMESNRKLIFALGPHDYGRMEKPLFVLTHVLSPHPPFTIDRDGVPQRDSAARSDGNRWIGDNPERRRQYHDRYLEKLQYTNGALMRHVEGLIENFDGPKVIIIHGDHGGGLYLNHDDGSATCLKERFSPFLAVYASDRRVTDALGDDMNLVNLYRVLFNEIFDTDLPALPSRSFFAPWEDPTQLQEIAPERLESLGAQCHAFATRASR